jgi:hypothetical protein
VLRALDDLEGHALIGRARHAWQVATDLGIELEPVGVILLLLLARRRQIRNLAVDDAETGRHRA